MKIKNKTRKTRSTKNELVSYQSEFSEFLVPNFPFFDNLAQEVRTQKTQRK